MIIRIGSIRYWLLIGVLAMGIAADVQAWYPRLDSQGTLSDIRRGALVGENRPYVIGWDETLMEIARRGGLGYAALVNANPGFDAWRPGFGHELILPYAAIVPAGLQEGITINLVEYRLYYIERREDNWRVRIYPIGLGREGWQTPEGDFAITTVIDNPVWTRPETMRNGDPTIPNLIEAGPENPLGSHWLGLSLAGYGIHGTNRPYGIGRRVSHGCIRLYPDDIVDLAGRVKRGTPVKIIYQPVKVSVRGNQFWVEVHPDYMKRENVAVEEVIEQARQSGWAASVDVARLEKVLMEARGVPTVVGRKNRGGP